MYHCRLNVLDSSLVSSEKFCFSVFNVIFNFRFRVIFLPCIFSSTIFPYCMRRTQITFSKLYTIQDTSLDSYYSQDLSKKEIEAISLQCSDIFQCWWIQMIGFFAKDSVVCNMPLETEAAVFLLRKYHEVALQFFSENF